MARLLELQSLLQEAVAGLVRFDQAIASSPASTSSSLVLAARSLHDQYDQLQSAFLAEAKRTEIDVCTYRMFTTLGDTRYTLNEVTTALQDFQRLFSTVHRALRPRRSRRRDEVEDAGFGIAYTFPGSLGIALTLPRELEMFDSNQYYDEAMQTVFAMAQSRSPDEIVQHVRSVGPTAVRQMDRWAADHVSYGLGADIRWKTQTANPKRLFIQPPEISGLRNAILLSDYSAPRTIEVVGVLVGADMDRKSFHFKTEARQDLRGRFLDAITTEHRVQLPAPYTAKIRVTTQTVYSTNEEEDEYFLLSLTPNDESDDLYGEAKTR